ncbi:MAG: nucleotidyl transferase AbiEii/AbiGii toxin family protein, partial [Chitinophagaceae bacterium]
VKLSCCFILVKLFQSAKRRFRMLHKEAVDNRLMVILKKLMSIHEIGNFSLVGGTALAFQFGHRKSEDIDLFCPPVEAIDLLKIESEIERIFPDSKSFSGSRISSAFYIEDIKVDFVYYPYKNIRQVIKEDEIRMFSLEDIAAMKIKTVGNRGLKKDFFDINELLKHFSLEEMFTFFQEKYNHSDYGHYLRSLTYFEDAEKSAEPRILNHLTWEQVKANIQKAALDFFSQKMKENNG